MLFHALSDWPTADLSADKKIFSVNKSNRQKSVSGRVRWLMADVFLLPLMVTKMLVDMNRLIEKAAAVNADFLANKILLSRLVWTICWTSLLATK